MVAVEAGRTMVEMEVMEENKLAAPMEARELVETM